MAAQANGQSMHSTALDFAAHLAAAFWLAALAIAVIPLASGVLRWSGMARLLPVSFGLGLEVAWKGPVVEATAAAPEFLVAAVLLVLSSALHALAGGGGGGGSQAAVDATGADRARRSNGVARAAAEARHLEADGSHTHSLAAAQVIGELPPLPPPRPAAEDDKGGRAACGLTALSCGARSSDTVGDFAPRLQHMIARCHAERTQGGRFRIFDDYTVEQSGQGGSPMVLTECRCSNFKRLRAAAGLTESRYFDSMCAKPFSGGKVEVSGKSGSLFLRSHDNRFVLKTIEAHEFEVLKDILPHMVLYLEQHHESLLCRFLGAYAMTLAGTTLRFVVMDNVLPRPAQTVYDLKGTTEDRWVDPVPGGVLKDVNFQPYTMCFSADHRNRLVQAICNDAEFLDSVGTMDYSLLVGVSPAARVPPEGPGNHRGWLSAAGEMQVETDYQLGIIDYLQRWTPKKVAAHWLKKATIGCFHEIDTEPPTIYRQRFCKYFLQRLQSTESRAQGRR